MANRNKRGEAARRNRKRNKYALYMSKFSDKYNKEQKILLSRKNKELSNIPVKEGKINNPDYGKKGDLSMFKETKKKENKKENKTENKTEVKNKTKNVVKNNSNQNNNKKSNVKTEKPDPLKDYRRGEGTKLGKDTRITKHLKKSGFTEDRLARLRKKHAEWKANRKKKKSKLKIGG